MAEMPSGSDGDTAIALGPHQSSVKATAPIHVTCILCQEEQKVTLSGRAMVLSAFVQQYVSLSF